MALRCYIAVHVDMTLGRMYSTKITEVRTKLRLVQRESGVGIATCYGEEGPGSESRWREIFRVQRD